MTTKLGGLTKRQKAKALFIYQMFSGLDEYASSRDQDRMESAVVMADRKFRRRAHSLKGTER